MGLNCGIVGLPNVGKSTLYNALCRHAQAEAANYPFCTIEPNIGRVPIPDERLQKIAEIAQSQEIIPASLEVVDIAGLVRGASQGEGLGNQFVSHIREVDAVLHLLRCYDEDNITHVEGGVDPLRDWEIIDTELMLADLQSLEQQQAKLVKSARGGDKHAKDRLALLEKIIPPLQQGTAIRQMDFSPDEAILLKSFHLLTTKPVIYVANVDEGSMAGGNDYSKRVRQKAAASGAKTLLVSAKIEAELVTLDLEAQEEFLQSLGLEESSFHRIIRAGADLLGLISYFTAGPKETRCWTIPKGTGASEAAGVIHTDFARGFIAAEVISYQDYLKGGEKQAKADGTCRIEGRDYVVQDGDIIHFRFNV